MSRDGKLKLYLIGYPIRHSLSPMIMDYIFRSKGINAFYTLYEVKSSIEHIIKRFREMEVYGFNVTIPYKEEVIRFLDYISQEADVIGAVNTVHNSDGELIGYNTDWYGVYKPITRFGGNNFDTALVIGAGGAAKAAVYGLKELVDKIYIANRTYDRAVKLCRRFDSFFKEMKHLKLFSDEVDRIISKADILINATPVGMKKGEKPINLESVERDVIVFDMIYKPLKTELIKEAEEKGLKTIDGLWMLIYQAVEAVKIWFNASADVDDVRRYILGKVIKDGGIW